jgi:diaminopimelate decarboxylase
LPKAAACAISFPNRSTATSPNEDFTLIQPDRIDRSFAGVPAAELAAHYGTPLYVVDLETLDAEIDVFLRAFGDRGIAVGYASKAFLCTALVEHLAATPLRLDVCSLGELITAERGGFPAGRIYFHGASKTDAELQAIAERRVAFNVIDNAEELERLAALAGATQPLDVMLRINTGIEAHTHEFIRTGGENTKFGIPNADVGATLARLAELPQLRLIGLHGHVGSQLFEAAPLLANLDELLRLAAAARSLGHQVAELLVGGGIGVEDGPAEPRPIDLDALAAALSDRAGSAPYRLGIEPGRALIARAGTALYRVTSVKRQGRRRFVIVDGGMNDNPRPMLYGARHPAELVRSGAVGAPEAATLAGRSCENDEIGEYDLPGDVAAGDLIAMRYVGAYTYSMASNYNRFGKPAVVFVQNGHHRRVIRAETPDEVLRNDLG